MIKLCVIDSPAVVNPRATATATTYFSRFLDGTAFRVYGPGAVCRACDNFRVGSSQEYNGPLSRVHLHALSLELTFANLYSLRPPVVNISVAESSAVLVPSTARSTTTDSAGFRKRAALWTRYQTGNCRRGGWRAG